MIDLFSHLLALLGVGLILVAAIGLIRLPDVLCQGHAAAKALTLGILLILVALWLAIGTAGAGFKILLAMVFQFSTVPVAGHLVARLAWEKGVPRWRPPKSREAARK